MMERFTWPFALVLLMNAVHAQRAAIHWEADLMSDRSFLENKGQFDGRTEIKGEKVLYAVDQGAIQVLFTTGGVTYRFDEKEKNYYRQRGDRSKPRMIARTDLVHMRWDGASPGVRLVAEAPRTHTTLAGSGDHRACPRLPG